MHAFVRECVIDLFAGSQDSSSNRLRGFSVRAELPRKKHARQSALHSQLRIVQVTTGNRMLRHRRDILKAGFAHHRQHGAHAGYPPPCSVRSERAFDKACLVVVVQSHMRLQNEPSIWGEHREEPLKDIERIRLVVDHTLKVDDVEGPECLRREKLSEYDD